MGTLHVNISLAMESKPDFDDSFMGHHNHHMPSCPSSTTSSFSGSSSVYDPFTPTSGRSTPGHSVDLESSLHMDINMDMTPPPPASYYTAAESNIAMMAENYSQDSPVRKHHGIAMGSAIDLDYDDDMLSMHSHQNYDGPAATQAFDGMTSMNSQLTAALSFVQHPMMVSMNDMCTLPPYHFERPPSHRSSPASSSMVLAPGSPESHHNMMDIQEGNSTYQRRIMSSATRDKTAALEQITKTKDGKLRRCQKLAYMPFDQVTTVKSPKHQCTEPGCIKTYSRKEHLKRHLQSKHGIGAVWPCEFCEEKREKPFNRFDNYKAHVKAHADASRNGHGRVLFVPDAVPRYKELLDNTKQRKPKAKSPEESDVGRPSTTTENSAKKRPIKREQLESSAGTPASSFDDTRCFGSRNSSLEPPMPLQMWEYNVKVEPH